MEVLENGDIKLRVYAPAAKQVTAGLMEQPLFPLTRGENGIWEGTLPFPGFGMATIDWRVGDIQVLNPFAPVYYSYSRPVNFIDVPEPGRMARPHTQSIPRQASVEYLETDHV